MQSIFRVSQTVACLILWRENPVTGEVKRLAIWLRGPSAAPGVRWRELWWHWCDAITHTGLRGLIVRGRFGRRWFCIHLSGFGFQELAQLFRIHGLD